MPDPELSVGNSKKDKIKFLPKGIHSLDGSKDTQWTASLMHCNGLAETQCNSGGSEHAG